MKYKHVIYEKEGPIARIIMNKPEKLNAYVFFGGEDAKEMWAAFDEAAEDDEVKVKLTGACGGCPMSQLTLKMGIEKHLKKEIPEIKEVVAVN